MRSEGQKQYRIFPWGVQTVAVVEGDRRWVQAANLRSIPAATRLLRALRASLSAIVSVGAGGLVSRQGAFPVSTDFTPSTLLDVLKCATGLAATRPVFIVPRLGLGRRRFYVLLVDASGCRVAFAKVDMGESSERSIQKEARVLRELASRRNLPFSVPAVLSVGHIGDAVYLVTEALPTEAVDVTPRWSPELARIRDEVAGAPMRRKVEQCSWWEEFAQRGDGVPWLSAELTGKAASIDVAAAHGDFAHWNMFDCKGRMWILDWEAYAPDAPRMSDEVRFLLGASMRAAMRRPRVVAAKMATALQCVDRSRNADVLSALAFLHARGVGVATSVANEWPTELRGLR